MTTAIKVENLSKKYLIGHEKQESYNTLRDSLSHSARSLARRLRHPLQANTETTELEEFWALKDINFEIKQGDRVGIIGRNGAGKSTLLKILSRITSPTSGKVTINGRVASLLEVGTGFHPELSGRENIFLNGAILGMRKAEIKSKFDEIVAFAEVEKFLDTPVKRYSSGMYVRLAFAVAAHLDPEILIVDEVLAVGDAQFQSKCLSKMDEVGKEGRTVLFVSHNFPAVQRFCTKGIYLESGKILEQGEIFSVLSKYQQSIGNNGEAQKIEVRSGQARFVAWQLNETSLLPHTCNSRDVCTFEFTLIAKRKVTNAVVGLAIWDLKGNLILATSNLDNNGHHLVFQEGKHNIQFTVRLPIKADIYQLDISLNVPEQIDRWIAEPKLIVLPKLTSALPENWHGLLNEKVKFETFQVQAD